MTFISDPITLFNLFFCIVTVILSWWWYKKTGSVTPLYIGVAFGLFGISHLATLFDMTTSLQPALIIIRSSAYLLVVVGLFFIARDAIQRKNAERALQESENRFRSLYEDNPSMYFTVDVAGNVMSVNRFGWTQLGYTEDELIGQPVLKVFVKEDQDAAIKSVGQCVENLGQVFKWELRKVRKDGSILWVRENARALQQADGKIVILIVCEDVTDRKRADEEVIRKNAELRAAYEKLTATNEDLRQNFDELHRSQRSLDEARRKLNLLNKVTFRDIQNAIFTFSGYLQIEEDFLTDPNLKKFHAMQKSAVDAVGKSLRFAKTYQELGIDPPLWQNVQQSFLFAISHLNIIHLSRKVDLDNLEIYADPLLETVFYNLVQNVILHGKTATEITFSFRRTGDGLTLIFEDNGVGIPDSLKEAVFTQGYGATKGLGLFLSREILSLTGITIRETGTEGKGARFEMMVPERTYRFAEKT